MVCLSANDVWFFLGVIGAILFFGRFYVQWIVAEIRGRYVIPVAFWYMSAFGSLLLFAYAYQRQSPGGTFGICFNLIVYSRNLVYVWKEQGLLTPFRSRLVHAGTGLVTVTTVFLTWKTWRAGYSGTPEFWVWSTIWAFGQALFFLRFLIQWALTEALGRSVIPAVFWKLSLLGLLLHGAYFTHRADWLLAVGTLLDGIPYARNLSLIRRASRIG